MEIHTKTTPAKLIGLTGYATSGKDALADCLVENLGYVKIGWADRIYDMALSLNPCFWYVWRPRRLKWIVDKIGWVKAKRIPKVRRYLQWLGSDVVREIIGEDAWIRATMPKILDYVRNGKSVVVTNCRFKNEAEALEKVGGYIVLVERPGVGAVNDHISESGELFSSATFRVINDKGLEDLVQWAQALDSAIEGVHPNEDMNMIPFFKAIRKGIASGVQLVLSTAAPASEMTETWMNRHRIECSYIDEGVEVFVDGKSAGKVRYSDNILEVDAKIAR